MAYFLDIPTFSDGRGSLSVIEDVLIFQIRRVYYIYNAEGIRGGHRHKKTIQALICLNGSCEIHSDNGVTKSVFNLNDPTKALIIEPEDWHTMESFSFGAVLLVLASEPFDKQDYIHEPY